MDKKPGFQKNYLVFKQEDAGYGAGKNPSGYIKIEVREGKGKLVCSVENLKEEKDLVYNLYLIAASGEELHAADAGSILVRNGAGELKWEFDPQDTGKSGRGIDRFNVFAVLAGYRDSAVKRISCPLAFYKGDKIDWRNRLAQKLYDAKKQQILQPTAAVNLSPAVRYAEVESKYKPLETKPEFNIPEKVFGNTNLSDTPEIESNRPFLSDEETVTRSKPEPDSENTFGRSKEFMGQSADELVNSQQQNPLCNMVKSGICKPIPGAPGIYPCAECTNRMQQVPDQKTEPIRQTPVQPYQQLFKQAESAGNQTQSFPGHKSQAADVSKLKVAMDRCFERYDPFRSKRKDYMWWKVNSPVNLNNVLYQNNMKTPLLFNPALMMAHFKYRHLIAGVYSDREKNIEYVVCGVPGVYSIDERPFGELCRWAQLEGTRPRYGAFGYWLVYIDPETGKFLSVK